MSIGTHSRKLRAAISFLCSGVARRVILSFTTLRRFDRRRGGKREEVCAERQWPHRVRDTRLPRSGRVGGPAWRRTGAPEQPVLPPAWGDLASHGFQRNPEPRGPSL